MDGWVTIGTELDTKQLEKDIKDSEKQLKKYESDSEKLTKRKAKLEIDISDGERNIDIFNKKIEQIYDNLQKERQKLADIPAWQKGDAQYEKQIQKVDTLNAKYNEMLIKHDSMRQKLDRNSSELDNINLKIKENVKNQGLINNKIDEMNTKLRKTKGFDNIKDSIDNVGTSLNKTIRKVGGWAVALIGVQSIYSAITNSIGILSQYDEQLATNIEYIKFALANTLKPVIEYLVNLAFKLLTYVNYIAKAWFGVNLFANSSAKSFKNAKDGLAKTNKEAQKLNKTLASFDEMNILQDSSQQDTSGTGGGGALLPDIDLKAPEDIPIPKWLQWIVDNKDIVIAALFGIAGGIMAIKLGADLLMGVGIGIAIAGIILLVQDIIKFIKDPSWDGFANILRDLAIVLAGVAIAMLAVNAANPVAWIILAIAAVVALVAAVIKNWDKIKEVLGKVGSWINDHIIKPVGNFFKGLWDGIVNGVKSAVNTIKNVFGTIVDFFKGLIDKIVNLFRTIGTAVGNVIGAAFKMVINGVLAAIENILNSPIRQINKLLNIINKVPGINIRTLNTFDLPRLAKGGIVNYPGPGVPIGGAIAGEKGREFVMPLEDSQMLSMVGEAIGKYITINANITNTMNGRVISRELQKVQNASDFAFNR